MTYEKEYASKGVAGTGLGLAIGALGLMAANGGNGLLGGLFGNNNCMWSDREVMLQRQIDAVNANQMVTAAITPYQIKEATCGVVRAKEFIPSSEIVYTPYCGTPYNGCNPCNL